MTEGNDVEIGMEVLTDEKVGQKGGRDAEDEDQDVGQSQIDYEEISYGSHPGRSEDNGHDATVADDAQDEDHTIRHAINSRYARRVSHHIVGRPLESFEKVVLPFPCLI